MPEKSKYEYNKEYAKNYLKKNFEDIKVRLPIGERDEIKEFAASQGESLNSYILRLIRDDMARSKK